MRRLALCALVALLVGLAVTPASSASVRPAPRAALRAWKRAEAPRLPKNWRFFVAIGRCEQPAPVARKRHGRWPARYAWGIDWHHPGSSYPGGLGVWAPLWTEKGIAGTDMASSADRATPIEQMIHAQRIVNRYGKYAWGCTGVALASAPFFD